MKTQPWIPELILYNGDFQTQDLKRPTAQAVAIANGRFVAVGDNSTVKSLAGTGTDLIDLKGRLGLPGFVDAHFHFYEWAFLHQGLDLSGCQSLDQFLQTLHRKAATYRHDQWIVGYGWTESAWPEGRMPTATDLDQVAPNHPVILWRVDLHLAVANSSGLQKAGIDHNMPDPNQGCIDRDQNGQPSGILRERAIQMVKKHLPRPSLSALTQTMRSGMAALHARGITGLHDIRLMGGTEGPLSMQALQQLDANGDLALRCWVGLPGERIDRAIGLGLKSGWGSDRLRIGHLKYFSDGSMGARTAWLHEPYVDAASGMPLTSMEDIGHAIQKADRAGLAVMVHAIGDRANHELVSIFEDLQRSQNRHAKKAPVGPRIPHRIEHLQMIQPRDLERLATLGVVASVQPHHLALDLEMIERSLGDRGRHCYVFKNMLNAGIPLMFGSDYPVCDFDPIKGIHSAVTRQSPMGHPPDGWYPDQRLTVAEAIRAYTLTPAEVSGAGDELGSVTPGKRADMVVLNRNIYKLPPKELLEAQIDLTVFDGQIVYER